MKEESFLEEASPIVGFFYTVPEHVMFSEDLSNGAKLLYSFIAALTSKEGYCWASNGFIAKHYNWGKSTVSRLVSELESNGFVKVELVRDKSTNEVKFRKIFIDLSRAKTGDSNQAKQGGIHKKD